jgi:hypothetical protein
VGFFVTDIFMGRFIINVVFGFACFFLFLASFGCILGLVTIGGAVIALHALFSYFLQQCWLALTKFTSISEWLGLFLFSSFKKSTLYLYNKTKALFSKTKQKTKMELLVYNA